MSANANPTPSATVNVSVKLKEAIQAVIKAELGVSVALDKYRNVARSETVRLALSDKKALTAVLFASGDTDARRVSEIVGFVFPKSESARKELDKAMERNAKESDPKKRIAKGVILALQRDDTGKLTLEKALAEHKATLSGTRTPGGQTNQTEPVKPRKKTAAEIEAELQSLVDAALKFGKANGYDDEDLTQVFEDRLAEAFPADDADGDDADNDDDGDDDK